MKTGKRNNSTLVALTPPENLVFFIYFVYSSCLAYVLVAVFRIYVVPFFFIRCFGNICGRGCSRLGTSWLLYVTPRETYKRKCIPRVKWRHLFVPSLLSYERKVPRFVFATRSFPRRIFSSCCTLLSGWVVYGFYTVGHSSIDVRAGLT